MFTNQEESVSLLISEVTIVTTEQGHVQETFLKARGITWYDLCGFLRLHNNSSMSVKRSVRINFLWGPLCLKIQLSVISSIAKARIIVKLYFNLTKYMLSVFKGHNPDKWKCLFYGSRLLRPLTRPHVWSFENALHYFLGCDLLYLSRFGDFRPKF